jgi:hypothetical protein
MGWSYYMSCKSKKAMEAMVSFLAENYRDTVDVPDLAVLFKRSVPCRKSPATWFNSSHEGPLRLGFPKPNDYEQAVLRWIAFRTGKRRTFKGLGISGTVPWLNYDGQQAELILTPAQWDGREETQGYVVDDIGWQGVSRWWTCCEIDPDDTEGNSRIAEFSTRADLMDKAIRAEIVRLNTLWNDFQKED